MNSLFLNKISLSKGEKFWFLNICYLTGTFPHGCANITERGKSELPKYITIKREREWSSVNTLSKLLQLIIKKLKMASFFIGIRYTRGVLFGLLSVKEVFFY